MIFNLTKGYVPEVYSESRDYRVFLKLVGALTSVLKTNIDDFPKLYSADEVPENLLPLLADMVGYLINDKISVNDNRLVVRYFPTMLRYRGSTRGIKLASALSLNTSGKDIKYDLSDVVIEYDDQTGTINIYYPDPDYIRKDLINYVRPLGSTINLLPSYIFKNNDVIDIKADIDSEVEEYNDRRHEVDKSQVGFSNVKNEE